MVYLFVFYYYSCNYRTTLSWWKMIKYVVLVWLNDYVEGKWNAVEKFYCFSVKVFYEDKLRNLNINIKFIYTKIKRVLKSKGVVELNLKSQNYLGRFVSAVLGGNKLSCRNTKDGIVKSTRRRLITITLRRARTSPSPHRHCATIRQIFKTTFIH